METKEKKNEAGFNGWKSLVQGFVGDILERIGDNVSKRVHVFLQQLKRQAAGAILMLMGTIFILVSLAILINTFLDSGFLWVGWGLIGLIIMLIGYKLSKA